MYLPSNTDFYMKIKHRHMCRKLTKELTLGSDWKCCVKEIHYPRSWNTLDHDEGHFKIYHLNQNTWETETLPPGHYESKQQFIDAINKVLSELMVTHHLTNYSVQHTVIFRAINVTSGALTPYTILSRSPEIWEI